MNFFWRVASSLLAILSLGGCLEKSEEMIKNNLAANAAVLVIALVIWIIVASISIIETSYWPSSKLVLANRKSHINTTQREGLLILHYHKTGRNLCRLFALHGLKQPSVYIVKHPRDVQKLIHNQDRLYRNNNNATITNKTLHSPFFFVMIASGLDLSLLNPGMLVSQNIRILHHVRDPLSWSLSAYLYHRQIPIPSLERKWMTRKDDDMCKIYSSTKVFWHDLLLLDQTSLESISHFCKSLILSKNNHSSSSLSDQLQVLSPKDGICFEAARGLLGSSHGEIIKMVSNMQWLYRRRRQQLDAVMTVWLDQFTLSATQFRHEAKKMCNFAFSFPKKKRDELKQCVESFFHHGWVGNLPQNMNNHSVVHVTMNQLSRRERYELKQHLKKHSVLGPPLRQIQKIMLATSTK